MDQRTLVWRVGEIACYVLHHDDAGSYEIQIRNRGTVIARRWFEDAPDADAFVVAAAQEFQAAFVPFSA